MVFRKIDGSRAGAGGFTLVEVAVALFVVGVGFTAVLAAFPTGAKWARAAAAQTVGARLAESYFNELRAQFAVGLPVPVTSFANDRQAWSSPWNAGDIPGATPSDWVEDDVTGYAQRSLLLNALYPGTVVIPPAQAPAMVGAANSYGRRNRMYETSAAITDGGLVSFPARETANGFFLCATVNIATLFPNHHNMSNVTATPQFNNAVFAASGQTLFAHADDPDGVDVRRAQFRLYDVYIHVYDSDPLAKRTPAELEKALVTTYRGRAWLGWQPPLSATP